ncbi:branched-chain amino acid transporter [Escherichia coli]|nr:branched-chain amino acid transporter [Escherichia coli]HAI1529489.1 branched-chain amino acid transporter [Escherichia coli]
MSKLSSEMKALAKKAGGSFKTVNDRIHITKRFSEHLRALNIQIQRVEQIKVRHIECYIEERLELDIGLRTLQNEMAALRAVLRQAGRRQVMEKARTQDAGLAAALEIARLMGLRSQEAVQSSQSLKTWLKAISRGETRLKVVFGTKGGHPRYTTVLDTGAGIQRKGVTGADGDGSGSWRRSRSLGETGVRLPLEGGMTEFMNVAK